MSVSLSDILTMGKNIVTAINSVGQSISRGQGNITSGTLTASTLVCTGSGYLVSVSVTVAGSAAGGVYNSSTVAGAAAGNLLAIIPDTAGVVRLGQAFTNGLVITPGSGQSINVTYYQ